MRKGNYVFIGIAAIITIIHILTLSTNTEFTIARLLGEYTASLIFYVGVPWLIYNWVSNKMAKRKQMLSQKKSEGIV